MVQITSVEAEVNKGYRRAIIKLPPFARSGDVISFKTEAGPFYFSVPAKVAPEGVLYAYLVGVAPDPSGDLVPTDYQLWKSPDEAVAAKRQKLVVAEHVDPRREQPRERSAVESLLRLRESEMLLKRGQDEAAVAEMRKDAERGDCNAIHTLVRWYHRGERGLIRNYEMCFITEIKY